MQCFFVTTRGRCVGTARGSCERYLVRVKTEIHLGIGRLGYEAAPICWHPSVASGVVVTTACAGCVLQEQYAVSSQELASDTISRRLWQSVCFPSLVPGRIAWPMISEAAVGGGKAS